MNNQYYIPYYPNNFTGLRNVNPSYIAPRGGLLSSLAGKSAVAGAKTFSFNNLLNGASKTLGVINQAIPVVYQVKPIWNNAKTMFRIAKEMKTDSKTGNSNIKKNINNKTNINTNNNINNNTNNNPQFFI